MERSNLTAHVESPWKLAGQYYQAPATLMVEGIHAGSHGPIFHPAHVLKANASKWEGMPVTLDHPQQDGQYIDVNSSKAIWDKYVVGRVIKPFYDEGKKAIRGVIQIPANHARAAEIMKLVGEVSVGIFSDSTEIYGQHGGQKYNRCSITHEPNHLAILPPGVTGACAISDGCGIRTHGGDLYGELREIAGQTIKRWVNDIQQEARIMANHEDQAVFPPEFYEANQEREDLETLKSWADDDSPPMHIQELRQKYSDKQAQGQDWTGHGYAEHAVYPLGVE